jgi:hypothetical protein
MPQKCLSYVEARRPSSDGGRATQETWGSRGSERGSDGPTWRKGDSLIIESGRSDGGEEK